MKKLILGLITGLFCFLSHESEAGTVTINGHPAGATPFISNFQLTASPAASIKNIKFQITPKAGSVTRPVTATYHSEYLKKRGYYNTLTGAILLPVFGLYANYNNTVTFTYTFTDNSTQQATTMVATAAFNDPCGYSSATILQARTNSTTLSYDYILIKNPCGPFSPTIIDTDGQIRWVGTAGFGSFASTFFQNSVYIGSRSSLYRMELDGTSTVLKDYSSDGVTAFHHNIDFGKHGLIIDVDTAAQIESTNMEVDAEGNILKTWRLADIITAAITAGGEDASPFVKPAPADWFHNNAVTYKRSDDSLLVSSRENFVIALDYATSAIKWVLGDTTKQWHQFQSLRTFALTLGNNTLSPIGEHALSITNDDNLLLFDNGRSSLTQTPAGADRTYSAPRKYHINLSSKVATELWNYSNNQTAYSPFCSSIYEDDPLNYLIDYAILGPSTPNPPVVAEVLGLDASGSKIFHYQYPATGCDTAWNSIPIHFERVVFTNFVPPRGDFNADTFNDYVLFNATKHTTPIWHLHGAAFLSSTFGPTLPAGWTVAGVADVNLDGETDYILFNATTRRTAVWFLNNNALIGSSFGPTLPPNWTLTSLADVNNDRQPDLVLFNPSTRQTAIWYLNGTTYAGNANGPTLPPGWTLSDALDLNDDDKPDFLLFNAATRRTAIWHLSGATLTTGVFGPTLPVGWTLQGAADFNGDGEPDYVLFRPDKRSTALWYLSGATLIGSAFGPTLPAGYSLAFP